MCTKNCTGTPLEQMAICAYTEAGQVRTGVYGIFIIATRKKYRNFKRLAFKIRHTVGKNIAILRDWHLKPGIW